MKSVRQLLRQPLKTAVGVALMILAAAIVCLCVGQALAAQNTKAALDERFSTVAIPLVQEHVDGSVNEHALVLDGELAAWIDKMAAEHPDIVRGMAKHGILSAYIPELTPYNSTIEHQRSNINIQVSGGQAQTSLSYGDFQASPFNMPYCSAMLVIRLDEIYGPNERSKTYLCEPDPLTPEDFDTYTEYLEYKNSLEKITINLGYEVFLVGTVTQVISQDGGYRDPVGRTANLTLYLQTLEQFEMLELVPGEEYIIYGMDYIDEHMELTSMYETLNFIPREKMDPFDPDLLYVYTPEEVAECFGRYVAEYAGKKLSGEWYAKLNAISMTLGDPEHLLQFEEIRDEDGYLLDIKEKTQYAITDQNGLTQMVSREAYAAHYGRPSIARLDGSVEDLLDSEEGAIWKAALECTEINNHAFAVIGVDKMDYLGEFSLKRSQIVEGRDFTQEERENGMRVCIVHELMAHNAGLQIGDTITLNLYSTDNNLPYQSFRSDGYGILNPSASFYFGTTPFADTAEYTIVGIYRGEKWPNLKEDPYAFSANTVFVPKSSVQTAMEECDSIIFNTLVLENGKIEEFHELARKSGFAGRFKYNDQNYSTIAANFHNYEALGRQMLAIGAVLYTVLLLLFLLLYPGLQKNNVVTMQSLGCGFLRRFWHIMLSSLGIVIPASLLGGWFGGQLWGKLVEALQTTAESTIALQIEPGALAMVAMAQLLFAVVLTICVALFVAAPRKMASRR